MCSRGVYQLAKLSVYFCDFGGSSAGVRSMLMSQRLKQFIQDNQHIDFNFICKRNAHPYLSGAYINGYLKNVPVRSYEADQVYKKMVGLRNQLGRSNFNAHGKRVFGAIKSIQGLWQPNMFNKYPIAELEKTHEIPYVRVHSTEVQIPNREGRKQKDQVNKLLRRRLIRNNNFTHNKGKQI